MQGHYSWCVCTCVQGRPARTPSLAGYCSLCSVRESVYHRCPLYAAVFVQTLTHCWAVRQSGIKGVAIVNKGSEGVLMHNYGEKIV